MRVTPPRPGARPHRDSHGGDVLSGEGIGGVADEKAGLAHSSERQEVREGVSHRPGLAPEPSPQERPGSPFWVSVSPSEGPHVRPENHRVSGALVKGQASGLIPESDPWLGADTGTRVLKKLSQVMLMGDGGLRAEGAPDTPELDNAARTPVLNQGSAVTPGPPPARGTNLGPWVHLAVPHFPPLENRGESILRGTCQKGN